jgi:hypothetical protein
VCLLCSVGASTVRHRDRCSEAWALAARNTISGMTDDDADRREPPSAKAITTLLREARSLSRRADELGDP